LLSESVGESHRIAQQRRSAGNLLNQTEYDILHERTREIGTISEQRTA
jgi:hypothetical protein